MKISEKKIRHIIKLLLIEVGENNFITQDRIINYCKNAGITRLSFYEWWDKRYKRRKK